MSTSPLLADHQSVAHALARDRLGPFAIGAAIASSVAPLTVVALVVPGSVAVTGLLGVPIAVIAVAAILLLFVVGYLAMARHIPNAGAFYAYVAHGIGRPFGVGTSWFALAVYNFFNLCCYGGFGYLTAPLVSSWVGMKVAWWVLALAAWLLIAILGANEIKFSEKVLVVLVVAETILVLAYSIAITLSSSPRSITSSSIRIPEGSKIRSMRMSPSQALRSHCSGGVSGRIPASASACWARSASSGLTIRSMSLLEGGPPRAQQPSPPPSR